MFDFLKKKITNFIDGIKGKEEAEKKVEEVQKPPKELIKEPKIEEEKPEIKQKPIPQTKPIEQEKPKPKIEEPKLVAPKKEKELQQPIIEKPKITEPKIIERKIEPKIEQKIEPKPQEPKIEQPKEKVGHKIIPKIEPVKEQIEPAKEKLEQLKEKVEPAKQKTEPEKERIKLSPFTVIKSFITSEVEVKESDLKELLDNLELELLEADVELSVSEAIVREIKEKLLGKKIEKKNLHSFIGSAIRETLIGVLQNDRAFDILEVVQKTEKPVKIMFIGINGAGKTTTIAKVAKLLMNNGHKVVFAAADTFRAAAIEQMDVHATRLGVKMIKRDYGSDPTSVAYDAANYAKAHAIDAVLIDTAGRQDTNISLINEIKKMNRVISPTLKIYVGESIAGNAIIEQVSTFNREIGIDGVILTKLDCDAKGGTVLSINKATGIPIVYIGTGQKYEDLELFDAKKIVDRIIE